MMSAMLLGNEKGSLPSKFPLLLIVLPPPIALLLTMELLPLNPD